jgi:hypothetical protein
MRASLAFLVGLLDRGDPAFVAWEDIQGAHGETIRRWQSQGFVSDDPVAHPAPSCPACGEGVPYRIEGRFLCNTCRNEVTPEHLLVWPLRREAYLAWLAAAFRLRGALHHVGDRLWQLGTGQAGYESVECFYARSGELTDHERVRLRAYRNALLFHGRPALPEAEGVARCVFLPDLYDADGSAAVVDLATLLQVHGNVRFDTSTGALWVGQHWLGEVPAGSKEHVLLDCLWHHRDQFVSYADLKRDVLRRTGSADTTEEATFCQGLKSRIKKKWLAEIDQLVVTSNKGDGYRLRGHFELPHVRWTPR